jgi:SAM-dependent methyltransferase
MLPGLTVKDGYMRHPFDVEFGVETSGLVRGKHLSTGHRNDRHNTAYYGIAPSVVETLCARWWASELIAPPEDYVFIDVGAGMGRAMLIAAQMPFREVIGVELHPELAAVARKNVAKWEEAGRARCAMRVVCQDVTEFEFPAEPCVAYLFNPFRAPVLKSMMRRMEAQFAHRSRELDLIYANDEWEAVLAANPRWERVWRGMVPLSAKDEAADRAILDHQPDGEYAWSTEEPSSIWRFVGVD